MRLFSYRLTSLAVSVLVGQSSPTLCNPVVWGPPGPSVHGNSSGKNIGVGQHFFLQGSFPHPGIQPGSPALQADSLPSEPLGKPDLADCISTHSKNKWLYAHGCEKGKALLRLVPCLQPQLFLWWQSSFSKTNWVYHLSAWKPYTVAISPDLWCTVAELLHLKSSLSDKIPFIWSPGPRMYSFYEGIAPDFQDCLGSSSGPLLLFSLTLDCMDLFTYLPCPVDCEFLEAKTISYSSFAI